MNFVRLGLKILMLSLLVLLPMSYNSCQSSHNQSNSVDLLSNGDPCDLKSFFERSYYPFLQTNCKNCHVSSGQGKGVFADSNLDNAYASFEIIGYSKISRHATDPSHKPPYTGSQHSQAVAALDSSWVKALEESEICKSGGITVPTIQFDDSKWLHTKSVPIGMLTVGATTVVSWTLSQDFLNTGVTLPVLSGAQFKLRISVKEVLNEPYYMITNPILDLTNASSDVILQGLRIKVNGRFIGSETSFQSLHAEARKGEGRGVILSSGVVSALGNLKVTDVVAVAFERVEAVSLPPPPAPVTARFRANSFRPTSESGVYDVFVDLSDAVPDKAVIVGLEVDGSSNATPLSSGLMIRNEDGVDVLINNFNWDYKLSATSLTFLPNETSKKVTIEVADDQRFDLQAGQEEFVKLRIGAVSGAVVDSTRALYTFTFPDNDPAPDPNRTVLTFTDLMNPGGVFYQYCIKCHNSVDKKGGYDITDYREMINDGVLLPTDYLNSEMYIRLNVDTPDFPIMPFQGGLATFERRKVEDWLKAGAKND